MRKQRSYLFDCPETGYGHLVETPDVLVLDWKEHEAVRVLLQQRLLVIGHLEWQVTSFQAGH